VRIQIHSSSWIIMPFIWRQKDGPESVLPPLHAPETDIFLEFFLTLPILRLKFSSSQEIYYSLKIEARLLHCRQGLGAFRPTSRMQAAAYRLSNMHI